jgi:5-methylcytosine-specific restriction endonuclease McrA
MLPRRTARLLSRAGQPGTDPDQEDVRRESEMIDFATKAPNSLPRTPAEELERLGDEIARLAAHLHAATYELLVLIRTFDEKGGWGGGFRSCGHWLSWRTGIGPGAAREKVRVARALAKLPLTSSAMARGELSFAKARAITRVATPDNESHLVELSRNATASHMEKLVRAWRRADRLEEAREEEKRHESRKVWLYPDDDGTWVLRGRLDPEAGALLERALAWASDALWREDGSEEGGRQGNHEVHRTSHPQRQADALGLVAERALARAAADEGVVAGTASPPRRRSPGRAHRFQVVLHVDAEALKEGSVEGQAVLEQGAVNIPAESSRRLTCDAGVVTMTHDPEGRWLDVGRRRRTVPPAIRRALEHRDGGCRFPGCGCLYTDAHHVLHWADGGATKLDNLVLLCRRHHRAVHEEGYGVEVVKGGAGVEVRFCRPDRRLIPEVPEAPVLGPDPVGALVARHGARGLEPDRWTPTPIWHGEELDYGLAVDMCRRQGYPGAETPGGGGGNDDSPSGGEDVTRRLPEVPHPDLGEHVSAETREVELRTAASAAEWVAFARGY